MRYAGLAGLYQKPGGVTSMGSGVSYSTQPTDIQTGILYTEIDSVTGEANAYQFVRLSGTATVGSLLYATGTGLAYVCANASGVKPVGVSLVAPTASGVWMFMQRSGRNTTVQITVTVGALGPTAALYGGQGSAAVGVSHVIAAFSDATSGGTVTGILHYIGRSLTVATGSTTLAYIDML